MNNQSQLNFQNSRFLRKQFSCYLYGYSKSNFNEVLTVNIQVRIVRTFPFCLINCESDAPSCRRHGNGPQLPYLVSIAIHGWREESYQAPPDTPNTTNPSRAYKLYRT